MWSKPRGATAQTMKPPPIHVPVTSGERIASLDVLRGFALLGVLVMNMQLFSMIEASLMNPAAFGDFTGINRIVWITTYLFGDLKFMANFSMLFGAGILLMTQRAEARTGKSAGLHYQRMFWLMMIGMVHAYVFWYGDILVSYAVTGMAVYLLRRLPARWLLGLGAVALVPPSLLFLFCQLTLPWWSPESLSEILAEWQPNSEQVASELAAYRGGWWAQTAYRAPSSLMAQVFLIPLWAGWRAGGMMLIGMALLKSGVLTAERSKRFYMVMAVAGMALGLPVVAGGIVFNFANNWSVERSMFLGYQFNYWGSVGVGLGYLAIIMLMVKSGALRWLQEGLSAMGKMALSNYLLQTLVCTTLFYGHGFGLFGCVDRWHQLLIALAILVAQMAVSRGWLRWFRYGPMEWLWRSLSYRRWQPLR